MNNSLRSSLYLLAPCVGLGGFALFLTRRPQPTSVRLYGPFQFSVLKAEVQKPLPINISEGYDRRFHLVLQANGARPKWWGKSADGRAGIPINGWKFWLERDGKRTPFNPTKTIVWTTDWDSTKKHYYNEFLLHSGDVPTDASLKASGTTRVELNLGTTVFKASSPFEVTLKQANEAWAPPQVSTVPRFVIRKIEIRRLQNGKTIGLVTVFSPPGVEVDHSAMYMPQILTGDWQLPDKPSHYFSLSFGGGNNFISKSPSKRVRTFTFQWSTSTVAKFHQRDLIVTERYSIANSWPLEIAFAIKKDGKSVFGIVPPLTRPASKRTA